MYTGTANSRRRRACSLVGVSVVCYLCVRITQFLRRPLIEAQRKWSAVSSSHRWYIYEIFFPGFLVVCAASVVVCLSVRVAVSVRDRLKLSQLSSPSTCLWKPHSRSGAPATQPFPELVLLVRQIPLSASDSTSKQLSIESFLGSFACACSLSEHFLVCWFSSSSRHKTIVRMYACRQWRTALPWNYNQPVVKQFSRDESFDY